ncbi:Predicted arabinose efflux permease, MFS family [Methylobacterium phyllostachyos]|uniref:Predicted arabinose efflux permease, MFS family n=1 Tax=Methylobacterium phyllostachyos TaxID=582672 RepID=A0A1G9R8E5_9HYPH|nr:MFS transporter [Methylobacterium phyllostachyos]SDM19503.1 Predicted arabinose efflux permease, MFS family [Methylobacterium phyllostachyos]
MERIVVLAFGMFALGLDAYVVAGLLPGIGASFGIAPGEAGQTVTVFTLTYALAAPVCATLLAGRPVRKILAVALVVFAVANALSAGATGLLWLLLARAFAGLAAGLYAPVAVAAAATLVEPRRKGRALAFTLGGMSTGTVIGVPVGLWIADRIGWQETLLMVALLGALAAAAIVLRLPDIPAAEPPSWRARVALLADPRILATAAVSFLTAVSSLGLYTYVAPLLDRAGLGEVATGYFWAWGSGGLIGSFAIGPLIDWTGAPRRLMALILAVLALTLAALPPLLGLGSLGYLPFLIWGAMGWASQAPQQHTLLGLKPEHGSVAVALNSSANYLGGAVGAALGGVALALAGLAALPVAAAGVAMAALMLQLAILTRRHSAAPA